MSSEITILLSTYNGENYLKEQLDSIFAQSYANIEIISRDDGSVDGTVDILNAYDIKILEFKDNLGTKGSFTELLQYAVQNSNTEYFMFCDQDDVWLSDKIEKTFFKMQNMEQEFGKIPVLIHTDLEVVDERLNTINNSFMDFQKIDPLKNQFHNLLIQNTITGCTVMINRELAKKCLPISDSAIMHDRWIGLVASQFGRIGYLDESTIKYRQHSNNSIGAKGFSISFIIKSIFKKVSLGGNITQAKSFLEMFENELDNRTKTMLTEITTLEQKTFWQKRAALWRYKLLKQGLIRNVGLFLKI